MTKYLATFYSDSAYAERVIEARSPEGAMTKARQRAQDAPWTLDLQSYDGTLPIEHIEIRSSGGNTVGEWQTDNLRLRLAAPELLEALELCVECLTDLARLDDGTPSISALNQARAAIAQAKGGAGSPLPA